MNCNIPYTKWNYSDNRMILSSVVNILADMFNTSARKRFDSLNNQIDRKQLSKRTRKTPCSWIKKIYQQTAVTIMSMRKNKDLECLYDNSWIYKCTCGNVCQ